MYTVSHKKCHSIFVHNFEKCWSILKILSLLDSTVNLQQASSFTSYFPPHLKYVRPSEIQKINNSNSLKVDVDVDVVDLRAQADASMPASNNNVNYTITIYLISNYDVNCDFRFREVQLGSHISYPDVAKIYQVVI